VAVLVAFTSVATLSAQSATRKRSAREEFAFFKAVTSTDRLSVERLADMAAKSGLTAAERDADQSGVVQSWSFVASDGTMEILVIASATDTSYLITLSPRPPLARMPDPLLAWILQRAPEAKLDTLVRDEFEVRLSDEPLQARGTVQRRGRQITTIRVSVAGEFLGTSTTNSWPN
jgi:hypothetical protein